MYRNHRMFYLHNNTTAEWLWNILLVCSLCQHLCVTGPADKTPLVTNISRRSVQLLSTVIIMSTPGEKSPYPPPPNNSEPRQVWADSSPAQGWTTPPPAYHETYPHLSAGGPPAPGVNIVHVVHPVIFGDDPVQTMCNHCGSNVSHPSSPPRHWSSCCRLWRWPAPRRAW